MHLLTQCASRCTLLSRMYFPASNGAVFKCQVPTPHGSTESTVRKERYSREVLTLYAKGYPLFSILPFLLLVEMLTLPKGFWV